MRRGPPPRKRSSTKAPSPCAAHHRRPSAGAEMTPTDELRSLLEREQRRPHGDSTHVVLRPVDRVDDPAASSGAGVGLPVLLAQDRVAGVELGEPRADRLLSRAVRLGDRRQVRLRVHHEVLREEPIHRDRVCDIRQGERKVEIGGHAAAWY